MTIHKALDRIFWRFKTSIKGNETDQEALQVLADFVNNKHNEQLEANQLYAKLYIYVYASFLDRYSATVFDPIPQKEMHNFLAQPIERIIERFKNKLNESELYAKFDDLNIVVEHPRLKTEETTKKEIEALRSNLNALDDIWDYETVKEQLVSMINLSIDTYKEQHISELI